MTVAADPYDYTVDVVNLTVRSTSAEDRRSTGWLRHAQSVGATVLLVLALAVGASYAHVGLARVSGQWILHFGGPITPGSTVVVAGSKLGTLVTAGPASVSSSTNSGAAGFGVSPQFQASAAAESSNTTSVLAIDGFATVWPTGTVPAKIPAGYALVAFSHGVYKVVSSSSIEAAVRF